MRNIITLLCMLLLNNQAFAQMSGGLPPITQKKAVEERAAKALRKAEEAKREAERLRQAQAGERARVESERMKKESEDKAKAEALRKDEEEKRKTELTAAKVEAGKAALVAKERAEREAAEKAGLEQAALARAAREREEQERRRTETENSLWEKVSRADRADDYRSYLSSYPNGQFRTAAERRLSELTRIDPRQRWYKE